MQKAKVKDLMVRRLQEYPEAIAKVQESGSKWNVKFFVQTFRNKSSEIRFRVVDEDDNVLLRGAKSLPPYSAKQYEIMRLQQQIRHDYFTPHWWK